MTSGPPARRSLSTSSSLSPERAAAEPISVLAETLRPLGSALAVVAHPDDESFGLGAVLGALVAAGIEVRLLCLTAGEASTVGASPDLAATRHLEVQAAAAVLGLALATLESLPDGRLATIPRRELAGLVERDLRGARLVVGFERRGVTGHPDHAAATGAALAIARARGLATLEWGVPQAVAQELRRQVGAHFSGFGNRLPAPMAVRVDRTVQERAIACHPSQDPANPVLRTRLRLQGELEWLRLVPAEGRRSS